MTITLAKMFPSTFTIPWWAVALAALAVAAVVLLVLGRVRRNERG